VTDPNLGIKLLRWGIVATGTFWVGIAVLTSPTGAKSAALSAPEVNQIAKAITVRIDGQNPGTGVIVHRNTNTYTVITAEHVVATPDEYEIIVPGGNKFPLDYKTVKKLPGVDLALLQFTSPQTYPTAQLGNSDRLTEGVAVYVAGFPGLDSVIKASVYNFTTGQLTARASQPTDRGYALVYTNQTLPGMSGGPVLDQQGQLIGIHGMADGESKKLERMSETVFVKTGFNLGIPVNTLLKLAANSLTAGSSTPIALVPGQSPPPRQKSTASDFFLQAANFSRSGNLGGALTASNQAIQINPGFAAAYSVRGNLRLNQNDLPGAMADFNQALRIDGTLIPAYMGRALTYSELGDKPRAIADYSQAIQLNPNYSLAYYNRGVVYFNTGSRPQALQDLKQAADLSQQQGDYAGYKQALETLDIATKPCRMSIYGICDR
jgi:serine protease Do